MLHIRLWCGNDELNVKLSVDLVEIVKFSSASDNNHLFLLLKNQDLLHGEIANGSNEVYLEKLYHNVLDMASSFSVMYFVSSDGRLFESAFNDLKHVAELKLNEANEGISVKAVTCCTSSSKNLLYLVDNLDRLWVRESGNLCPIEISRENAARSYWKEQDPHHFMMTSGIDYCVILMGVSNSLDGIGKQYCETSFTENETIYTHTESCPCLVSNESQKMTVADENQSESNQMKCVDIPLHTDSMNSSEISQADDVVPKNAHNQQMCVINISKIACRANALSDKSAVHIGRILLDTEVWACGNNRRGQLGMGDQVPRHHGALCINQLKCRGLKYLASGSAHTVALAIDGKAWAWGDGSAGQLGNLKGLNDTNVCGSSSPRIIHWPLSIGKVIDIAAGSNHTILLSDSGIVFTLGKVVNNSKSIPFELKSSCDDGMEPIQVFASGNFSACVYSPIKLKKDLPILSVLIRESRELLAQALSLDYDLFPLIPSSPLNKSNKEKNQNYLDAELDLVIQAVTEGHRRILSLVTLMVESLVWYERDLHLGNQVGVEYIAPIFHPDEYVKVYRAYLEAVCDLLAFEGFRDVQHYSSLSIQRMKSLFPGETDDKIISNALFKPLDHLKFYLHLLETFSCKIMCGMKDCGSSLNQSWLMQKVCLQGKTLSVPELSSLSYHVSKRGILTSQSEMCSLNAEASFDKVDTGSLKESFSNGSSNNNITICPHGYPIEENIFKAKKMWNTLNVGEEWNRARLRAEKTRQFWEEHNRGGMVLEKWRQRGEKNVNKKCSWQPRLHSQRLVRESRPSKPRETPSLWLARPATLFTSAASASSSPSSSSPSFVLLTDAFLQISPNGQVAPHNLSTLWVELLRDSWEQEQGQPIPQNALQLTMPEDTLTVVASNAEERMAWLKTLQSAIMLCLRKESPALLKNATGIPPVSRNASYLFLRHLVYKDAIYTGGWLFGRPNGKGVMEWSDGRKIEGIFKDGLANGHARQQQPNIGTYDGQWKNGLYHGYGVMRYANGAVYEGEWREGLPEGHGIRKEGHFLSSVASMYVGDWVAGVKHGYGVMDDILTGEKYLGLWEKGEKHGNGLIVSLDGVYHEGTFVRGTITGHGVMVLEEGTHYEGELRGTGLFGGRGKLTLAPGGHGLEGMFSGSWDNSNGVKINNGTFHFNRAPTSPVDPLFATPVPSTPSSFGKLCVPPHQKWRSLFQQCREELGLKAEDEDEIKLPGGNMKGFEKSEKGFVDVQKVWENVAIAITRSQLRLKQKLQQQPYEKSLHKGQPDDSIFKSGDDGLVTIPNFGRKVLDKKTYIEVQKYLMKATESSHHPLGHLVASMTSAFTATYGGVRVHPLLLPHAVSELGSLTIRLYAICRLLFPALPSHENEVILFSPRDTDLKSFDSDLTEEEDILGEGIVEAVEEEEQEEEVVTATGLLHPILLPRIHSSLFVLYALHNKVEDDAYWLRLRKLNSHDNLSLMAFLDVHRKFWVCASPSKKNEEGDGKTSFSSLSTSLPSTPARVQPKLGHAFVDAVETLQQLKTTFCPLEKLEVIHKTFEHMACTIQKMMGSEYMGMDDLFPVFHFVVVRAQILQLGSEIHFVEDFIEPHLQNGELGMMFTTLKACYYQILQEKSS